MPALSFHLNVALTTYVNEQYVYQALSHGFWYSYTVRHLPDGREIVKVHAPDWQRYLDSVDAAIAWLNERHEHIERHNYHPND